MRIAKALMIVALTPTPALAQTGREAKPATITVSATASVESAPDKATLSVSIRGDGKTADAASAALAARQKAVISGLRSLDPKVEVRTGAVSIREAYAGECDNGDRFAMMSEDPEAIADTLDSMADTMLVTADDFAGGVPARTGKKDCTVVGRVAQIETSVIMNSVKDAGTAVGLAGRLGASRARIDDFGLRDDSAASNRAIAKAMENARAKAQAIATASGARLGQIVSVDDGSERGMSGGFTMFAMQAPAEIAPPPIVIDVSPKPVETSARLTVTFAIER
jgi:uncharacterized protein YggE